MEKRLSRILKDHTSSYCRTSSLSTRVALLCRLLSKEDAADSSDRGNSGNRKSPISHSNISQELILNQFQEEGQKCERSQSSNTANRKPPGERLVPTKPTRREPTSKADKKPAAKNDEVSNLIAEDFKQQLNTGHMTP